MEHDLQTIFIYEKTLLKNKVVSSE